MTRINPLNTDIDSFADELKERMRTLFDEPGDYKAVDLDDFYMDLAFASKAVKTYEGDNDMVRRLLIELSIAAAIIWHALGENQEESELDYAA